MQQQKSGQRKRFKLNERKRDAIFFYILVAPFVIMFFAIKVVPFINGLYLSFTNYTGYNYGRQEFVAL